MHSRHLIAPLFALLLSTAMLTVATPTANSAEPTAAAQTDAVELGAEPPHNICFGGLENRKLIVPEEQLSNPFRQTTHLGCTIDGGQPAVMPDLPAPTRIRTVLG